MVDQLFLARLMIHAAGLHLRPRVPGRDGQPGHRHQRRLLRRQQPGRHLRRHGHGDRPGHHARRARRAGHELLAAAHAQQRLRHLLPGPLSGSTRTRLMRPLVLALVQMLWDRSDPERLRAPHDRPIRCPTRRRTRCSCTWRSAIIRSPTSRPRSRRARSARRSISRPSWPGGTRDVNPYFGIPAIPTDPFDGSALIVWDSGADTPPTTNTPPSVGADPHSHPRSSVIGAHSRSRTSCRPAAPWSTSAPAHPACPESSAGHGSAVPRRTSDDGFRALHSP